MALGRGTGVRVDSTTVGMTTTLAVISIRVRLPIDGRLVARDGAQRQ